MCSRAQLSVVCYLATRIELRNGPIATIEKPAIDAERLMERMVGDASS